MAKPLVFLFGDTTLSFTLIKVDRSKLYGFKEVQALDEQERRCELVTLADDGRTLVGRGGTGIGSFAPDGTWCDKPSLVPQDLEGNRIEPVPSSFSAPVPLVERVTAEHYLEHDVRSVYLLEMEDDASALVEMLRKGAIFKFPYSYRGGLEADAGFLLMDTEGNVFLAVGNPTSAKFLSLQQVAPSVEEEEGDEQGEADLMDFDMI